MSPLTVVHIITKLELGGAQKVCLSLCKDLPAHGIQTILISGQHGALVQQAQELNHTILLPSFTREVSLKSMLHELKNFFALVTELKRLKKQYPALIVHTHSTKAGLVGRWAAFFARIKIRIHTIHGFAFHEHLSWYRWLPIYALELITSCITNHFICVAHSDAYTGIKLFPQFKKKYSVIRAAVDWGVFYQPHHKERDNFPEHNNPFIFGTVACFKAQKNIFDLLQAFAYVHSHNNNARLEIIGDGHLRPAIEEWIHAHALEKHITLHGWQYNVLPFLHRWHAFTLTSLWEGLPCAIIEARLLGIPIISYDTGGIREVVIHNSNGFLYEQKKWQLFAHGMLTLTQHKNKYTAFKTYSDNLEEFKISTMIHQHTLLYKKILNT